MPINYSFGASEFRQLQPVVYDSTNTIVPYGQPSSDRNGYQYIASTTNAVNGSLTISGTYTNETGITVTINSSIDTQWRVFGDIETEQSGTINAGVDIITGLTLSGNHGIKKIFLQLGTGTDRATHYQGSIDYQAPSICAPRWNTGSFIDSSFRNHNPSTGNIVCALYGDGSGTTVTAYTKNRSGYNSGTCDIANMNVEYISSYENNGNNTFPYTTVPANTIYVLLSGSHITTTAGISLSSCSAVIGSGENTIFTTAFQPAQFNMRSPNAIIDNIHMDGFHNGQGGNHGARNNNGIFAANSFNATINNIKAFRYNYG